MNEEKDIKFYTELITVTIIALVAANIWTAFMLKFINKEYPSNLSAHLIIAIVITVIAIFFLHMLFGGSTYHSYRLLYR